MSANVPAHTNGSVHKQTASLYHHRVSGSIRLQDGQQQVNKGVKPHQIPPFFLIQVKFVTLLTRKTMLRVSYLKHQLRQNWMASIKAGKDKHSTAGVSLTSQLEYVKFDGSHRLFPAGFGTALCPTEAWFTGYFHEILSSSHFVGFFFPWCKKTECSECLSKWIFFAVYLYRECWREWECLSKRTWPQSWIISAAISHDFLLQMSPKNRKLNSY